MALKIEFDFGTGFVEYEAITNDFIKTETLYKNLKPADNSIQFSLVPTNALLNSLRLTDGDIPVKITDSGSNYFIGYLRKTYNIAKLQRLQPVKVEVVSPSFHLKRKIKDNTTLLNYSVCDTSSTSTSLVHYLLSEAGVTNYTITTDISTIIPVFTINEDDTYYDVLKTLLFEYQYLFDFDKNGYFVLYELFPTSVTTSNTFDGTNILESILQTKKEEERDSVRVHFKEVETLNNTIIFSDTTNAGTGNKCNIEVDPNSYFGKSDISDSWYADYAIDGKEILSATGVTLDIEKDSDITVETFTAYNKRALLKIKNTNSTFSKFITQLDIKGNAVVIKSDSYSVIEDGNENVEKIDTKYVFDKTTADNLASGIKRYYQYSDFTYKLKSKTDYDLGDYVEVSETGIGTNTCRVIQKKTVERTGIIEYELEAVTEFIPIATSVYTTASGSAPGEQITNVVNSVNLGLNDDGTLKQAIDSNTMAVDITPSGDGLFLTKSFVGLFKDGARKSYIDIAGDFEFNKESSYLKSTATGIEVKGTINADEGYLDTLDVSGTLTIGTLGSIVSGTNIIDNDSVSFNQGSIGGWTIASGLLSTSNMKIDSDNERIYIGADDILRASASTARWSVFNNTGSEVAALGFFDDTLLDPDGNPYTTDEYGLYIKSGNKVVIQTQIDLDGSDLVQKDGSFSISESDGDTVLKMGTESALVGMHFFDNDENLESSIYWSEANNWLSVSSNLSVDNGVNTNVNIISDDTGASTLSLYGSAQGTGRVYVGQSTTHGGGIEYNGDGSPVTTDAGSDYITLWRRSAGTDYWTARNKYSSNDWEFRGAVDVGTSLTVNGSTDITGALDVGNNTTIDGELTISHNQVDPVYSNGQLELKTTDGSDVSLGFHRGGYTACQLRHESNGLILSGTSRTNAANLSVLGNLTVDGTATFNNSIHLPYKPLYLYTSANENHSILSKGPLGTYSDDIRINSYGAVYINLDSNNNNTDHADFVVCRHSGTGVIGNSLFKVSGEGGGVSIYTTSGNLILGPQNADWCHLETDRVAFYTNKSLHVNGAIYRYGTTYGIEADGDINARYLDVNNNATIDGSLTVGGHISPETTPTTGSTSIADGAKYTPSRGLYSGAMDTIPSRGGYFRYASTSWSGMSGGFGGPFSGTTTSRIYSSSANSGSHTWYYAKY